MIRKKLVSKGGMTLTEVLVAVLVFTLLTIVIVYGTTSALRIYRKGVMASEARTLTSTLTQSLSNELRYAKNVRQSGDTPPIFNSDKFGQDVTIQTIKKDKKWDRICIVSGGKSCDLLGEKAYTSGLQATVNKFTYDTDRRLFTINLTVFNDYVSQTTELSVGCLNT